MAAKTSLTLEDFGKKLHSAVYSSGRESEIVDIALENEHFELGRGYFADRVYSTEFNTAKVRDCRYDSERERDEECVPDAVSSLRHVVFPAVVEELQKSGNSAKVRVRKAEVGKDVLKD